MLPTAIICAMICSPSGSTSPGCAQRSRAARIPSPIFRHPRRPTPRSSTRSFSSCSIRPPSIARRSRRWRGSRRKRRPSGLAQDLVKAEQKTRLQQLVAPVDGAVQQLAVHTVGGVVTPAQPLLVVVPSESRLEIEAMVSNRDIGFVHAGQAAEIKIDTFNFTRYGLLHGRVLSVSQDAIIRDRQQDRSNDRSPGAQNETSEPKGQELN